MDVFTREKGWQPGAEEGEEDQMAYGCLFCMTGREEQVAARIRDGYPAYRAVSLRKMRYRTSHGQRTSEVVQLLPSYVFLKAPAEANPFRELPKNDVIRILTTGDGEWRLRDGDRRNGFFGTTGCSIFQRRIARASASASSAGRSRIWKAKFCAWTSAGAVDRLRWNSTEERFRSGLALN